MTHDTVIVTVTFCEILEEWYYTASITHVDLKANTWSIRIGLNSSSTDPGDLVYKIDSLLQSSLLSFLVLTPIQDSIYWSTLRFLSCNIRTQFLFLRLSNTGPSYPLILSLSSTKEQYCSLVKKSCWILDIRDILDRQGKFSCLFVSKLTSTLQTYHLLWMCCISLSFISSILQIHL